MPKLRRIERPLGARRADRCPAQRNGFLGERLALLNRSQNWLAREIGVSPGYISMLVNGERAPSGRIRKRMLRALGLDHFNQIFQLEEQHDDP